MAYYFPPQQKPQRWGNFQSVQYAIRKNSEKIFGVDPDSNVLVMPLFWGFPCLDFSGKQNHGTPVGGVAYHSGSLDFETNTQRVTFGSTALIDGNQEFSLSMGIKLNTFKSATNDKWITLKTVNANSNSWYVFAFDNAGYKDVSFGLGLDSAGRFPLGSPVAGEWKHVVWTFHGNNLGTGSDYIVYVNGVSVVISATGDMSGTTTGNMLSSVVDGGAFLDGLIADTRINNIALTAEQTALFYARPWDLYRRVGRTYYSVAAAPSIYIPQIMIF